MARTCPQSECVDNRGEGAHHVTGHFKRPVCVSLRQLAVVLVVGGRAQVSWAFPEKTPVLAPSVLVDLYLFVCLFACLVACRAIGLKLVLISLATRSCCSCFAYKHPFTRLARSAHIDTD